MTKRKKILILGPISNFGGREVEAQRIAQSLVSKYAVSLLSTVSIISTSSALIKDLHFSWSSIEKEIYDSNLLLRLSSNLTKQYYRRKEKNYRFIGNRCTAKFFSFENLYLEHITKNIKSSDVVIFCGEVRSKWLQEIFEITLNVAVPLIIRTTGTIRTIPQELIPKMHRKHQFLVHSYANYQKFRDFPQAKVVIIDQTTLCEEKLLALDLGFKEMPLTYGYIGRFGKEKGIVELLEILDNQGKKLVIAGTGPQQQEVLHFCAKNEEFQYQGALESTDVHLFYDSIDVLIIPSYEEAGPLVGIEAMAAGKLIISTKVGAMSDRLEALGNQFWFDIEHPKSLLDNMQEIELLERDVLLELKKELRNRYLEYYRYDKISSLYAGVISNILS